MPASIAGRLSTSASSLAGEVRVHTGAESQRAAAALNANAFTVGRDIHFGAGQYQPGTTRGNRIIAHEAAHALQPEGAPMSDGVSRRDDAAEMEADAAADAWTSGHSFVPSERRAAAIHRDDKTDPPKKKTFLKEGFTGRETEEQARLIAASKGWIVEGRMYWNGRNWIGESVRPGTGKERAIAQVRLDMQPIAESTTQIGAGDFENAFPDSTDVYFPGEEYSERPPRFGEGESDTGDGESEGKSPDGDPEGKEEGSKEKAEGETGSSTGTGANELDPLTALSSFLLDPSSLSELKKNTTGESGSPAGGIGWITGPLAKVLTVFAAALSFFTGPVLKALGKLTGLAKKFVGGFINKLRGLLRMSPKTLPGGPKPPVPPGRPPVPAETPEPNPGSVPEEVPAGSPTDTTARLANPNERLGDQYGNFLIKGKKPVLNGKTYEWEIYGLEQVKPYPPGSSLAAPLKAVNEAADLMIAEARAAGATQLKIWGKAIGNQSVADFQLYVERKLGGIVVDYGPRTRLFIIPVK